MSESAEIKNYSFIRIIALETKSRGKGSLGQALGHLDRHSESADISRADLTHLNRSLLQDRPAYKKCVEIAKGFRDKHNAAIDEYNATHQNSTKKRHMRKTSSQFMEGLLTYSPSFAKNIDVDTWVQKTYDFIQKEYVARGCELLRCELHCDEGSIHIHFVAACWNEKEQNATFRAIAGGKAELSQLQDRYGEAMSCFGLERGFSRYKQYEYIKQRAAKFYKTDNPTKEQIAQYAAIFDIELPKIRRHQTLKEYKAKEQEHYTRKIEELRQEWREQYQQSQKNKETLARQQDNINAITKQLENLKSRVALASNLAESNSLYVALDNLLNDKEALYYFNEQEVDDIVNSLNEFDKATQRVEEVANRTLNILAAFEHLNDYNDSSRQSDNAKQHNFDDFSL